MRRVFLALLLASVAWAADCGDYDVVLEVEDPPVTLAGAEFELDGEEMVFSGGACLETEYGALEADRIVYDRQTGSLSASEVDGEVSGWRVAAPRMAGDAEGMSLFEARLRRGDTVLDVAVARLRQDGAVEMEDLEALTSRYRFRARRGLIEDGVFRAVDVWSTPCKCGSAIEIDAGEAEFVFSDGKLYLRRADFRLYGVELARPREVLVEPDKEMRLEFPLRFSYASGWRFGVENLPLMIPGEAFGRWSTHLTALASGVGGALYPGKTESLTLAYDYSGADGRLHFGLKPVRVWDGSAWEGWVEPDVKVEQGPVHFGMGWDADAATETAYLLLADTYRRDRSSLTPFFRLAREAAHSGLSLGVKGEGGVFDAGYGDWRLRASLPYVAAVYPDAPFYLWGGGSFSASYGRIFSLRAQVYRSYGAPRYAYESRAPLEVVRVRVGDRLWAGAGYGRWISYDLAGAEVAGYRRKYDLSAGWRGEDVSVSLAWFRSFSSDAADLLLETSEKSRAQLSYSGWELSGEWNRSWDGDWSPLRSEVWFLLTPPLADCAGGWRISPSIGYDLLGGGISRVGADLEINDCCFTWKLGYRGVFDADAAGADAAGHSVTFSVALR